jgi:imidazolonepropionase-like amidohydrolase
MKVLLAVVLLLLLRCAAGAETVVIVNVAVLPMSSEEVLENRTVVVTDGRIAEIGSVDATEIPPGSRVVDGTDRWLMPGLAEMHGHVTEGPELERTLELFVANGVTVVRGMLGRPAHLALRESLRAGEILGPRLFTSGPSFNGRSVDGPDSAVDMVRRQHEAGYDFLKIHPGLSRAEFDAMAGTANDLGIPFAGHVPEDVGVPAALEAGIATIDHLDGYMQLLLPPDVDPSGGLGGFFGLFLAREAREERIGDVAAASADAGVWNVPTEALFEHVTSPLDPGEMAEWPEMRYMPAATLERWMQAKREVLEDPSYDPDVARRATELRRQLIRALHEAGAGLLLGSDSPQIFNVPGFAIHRELEYLVAAGLTPYEALRAGTVDPARFFGKEGVFGTVERGAEADLVLLDDSPLADIRNTRRIHGVMLRGRWLDRRELDSLLQSWVR